MARIALEKLIVDGRIHPARIEEMVEKAQREVEVMIKEEGEAATLEVGVHGIHLRFLICLFLRPALHLLDHDSSFVLHFIFNNFQQIIFCLFGG